jgi:putative ABC transport system substrate-binding protein
MRRRTVVLGAAAGAMLAAAGVRAQRGQTPRPRTIGMLYPNPTPPKGQGVKHPMFARLIERGWVPGENVKLENASAEGHEDRLPALAAELVRKRVDVIWAAGPEATLAAARVTRDIPIVFYGLGFPVELGVAQSLARPGGNVTGLAYFVGPEIETKQLEVLREIAPGIKRVSYLTVPASRRTLAGQVLRDPEQVLDDAARKLGFQLTRHVVGRAEDLDRAFAGVIAARAQALLVAGHPVFIRDRKRITAFTSANRLPSAFPYWEFVDAGGLVSYGVDRLSAMQQSFLHVDRILRGATPAELPIELPAKYLLAVNIGTARALGFTVPQSVLVRADRVVE